MKILKKSLCIILALLTICTLCACGNPSGGSSAKSSLEQEVEQVRSAVQVRGSLLHWGTTIGGNEIKSSDVTITNVKKMSDTEYIISGKIVMRDIYGTNWNNTFDCTVNKLGDT